MATGARGSSSIAADVDAAIERVVDHFESRDVALRLDVLRALSAQAQVAFETTRMRQRLERHPVSMGLIHSVTTPHSSAVYKTLTEKLLVDSCSCHYDVKRNVVMATDVRWTLGSRKATKKRKKSTMVGGRRVDDKTFMLTKYRYERVREEGETLVQFSIGVAFGDDDVMPRELLYFEMACESPYPKSYYEEKRHLNEEDGGGEESKKKWIEEEESDEEQEEEGETFGEEVREFRFSNEVLADMGEWMGAGKEELNPVDVVGFFVALPVHEDEWLVDERVGEILVQGGMGADSSDEECSDEDEDNGGDESEL